MICERNSPAYRPPRAAWVAAVAGLLLLALPGPVHAQDPENCLTCHRFRGLSRLNPETNELRLFFCSAEYYVHRQGAHARLRCTDCHERSEVRVIPHAVKTPVSCTQTCHITPAAEGLSLEFSHKRVHDSLQQSVHRDENLAEIEFDPPLLHPDQSECLYCHDQPVFGLEHGMPEGFLDHSGGTRCDTCHREELPLEIQYFANHVAARMKPARPVRQLAQVCAVCHSNEEHIERTGTHDAVASYLHSFHGKASLLGSKETATCVDCHSSPGGDQHLMLAADVADSPTNPVMLPDTCRTVACHPGAPPQMGTAAVHLPLDPATHAPEFYVAAFFIVMTATVMAVFFLYVILELINAVVRRPNEHYRRMSRLVQALQAHPEAKRLLARMPIHARIQHWILAISFIVLVITGMPIKFADAHWSEWVVQVFGGLSVVRALHRISGVILIAIFLYHVGYLTVQLVKTLVRDRRAGRSEPIWKVIWNSPMMMRPSDMAQFGQLFAYLLGFRRERPRFGKYNILDKFEYWAVFWGAPIMGLTGLALWGMPWVTENLSGRVINFAFIVHSDEAYLAFIYIAAVHMFTVVLSPGVFPISLGTLTGQAPVHEMVEGHSGELEEIAARYNIHAPPAQPKAVHWRDRLKAIGRQLAMRVYALGGAVAYGLVAFIALRFLLTMLFTHESAPAEIVDIPKRLDADAFLAAAAAPDTHKVTTTRDTRGPLAHFHLIPQWFQPDPGNSCTTSGCHNPLPHGNRIEVRAFLNMHATFTDCVVCHAEGDYKPEQVGWFALPDREACEPPAILRLAAKLEGIVDIPDAEAEALSTEAQALLREALPASGNHPQLQEWLLQLETTHPRSRVFRNIIAAMQSEIHLHVRGEYAAKLGLFSGGRRQGGPDADQRAATAAYLKQADKLDEPGRKPLLERIHKGVTASGAMCTPCHAPQPSLADVNLLGYPQHRVNVLQHSQIMRSVLSIESGKPFYLPLDEDRP